MSTSPSLENWWTIQSNLNDLYLSVAGTGSDSSIEYEGGSQADCAKWRYSGGSDGFLQNFCSLGCLNADSSGAVTISDSDSSCSDETASWALTTSGDGSTFTIQPVLSTDSFLIATDLGLTLIDQDAGLPEGGVRLALTWTIAATDDVIDLDELDDSTTTMATLPIATDSSITSTISGTTLPSAIPDTTASATDLITITSDTSSITSSASSTISSTTILSTISSETTTPTDTATFDNDTETTTAEQSTETTPATENIQTVTSFTMLEPTTQPETTSASGPSVSPSPLEPTLAGGTARSYAGSRTMGTMLCFALLLQLGAGIA